MLSHFLHDVVVVVVAAAAGGDAGTVAAASMDRLGERCTDAGV